MGSKSGLDGRKVFEEKKGMDVERRLKLDPQNVFGQKRSIDQHVMMEKLLLKNAPVICEKCGGRMKFAGSGSYECVECGNTVLDNFGIIKQYLEEHGPTPAIELEQELGIDRREIEHYLRQARLEIPEGSKFYLQCERCGVAIRCGRVCPDCAREVGDGKKGVAVIVGERPKYDNSSLKGRMRFMDQNKKGK